MLEKNPHKIFFEFDLDKGIESIVYISHKIEKPTFFHIFNIMYFADKKHLEKYGRLICGNRYTAMKYGLVPKEIYDLLNMVRRNTNQEFFRPEVIIKTTQSFTVEDDYRVNPLRKADLDLFSDSDLECLDDSIQCYSSLSFEELKEINYKEKAWIDSDEEGRIKLETIISTLKDGDLLMKHLQNQHPELGEAN